VTWIVATFLSSQLITLLALAVSGATTIVAIWIVVRGIDIKYLCHYW
jgi:hypothetical protein